MKEKLSPETWAAHLNKSVNHKLFGMCKLVGIRTECYENNNLMLMVHVQEESNHFNNGYFWVYDYETEIINYQPNLYL